MKSVAWLQLQQVERFLWAAVLVALPVTSFRYIPFMGAETQVRPLSLIPAALLLAALGLRCIREHRLFLWSSDFQPLLVFVLVALMATAAGFLLEPVNLYSYTYSSRVLRAWLSLGIGLVFLVTSMSMNRDESDLRFTIKWIYVGLIAEVAWSLVQFVQIYIYHFRLLDLIQKTVMMAGLPPNGRISGLALEPSWLAAQVITLYLPWAFAALLKGYDWGGRRWMTITILAVCAFLLTYTFSRAGVLTALAALILTFLIAGRERIRQAWRWFTFPLKVKSQIPNKVLEIGLRMVVIAAVLAGLTGGTYILSRNRYFATIWHSKMTNLTTYFVDIYAGPRLAYSWAGWNIFTQHPWTGVGLGAAGFYLPGALPDWAHFNNPDISSLLSPTNQTYPNTKDLYIRLLSETGILGFWSFLAFYLLAFGKVMILCGSKRKHLAFLGAASLLAWISILTLGFTQDSLAMPVIWVPLGILMGMIPTDSGLLPQPAREDREPAQQEKA